MLLSLIIGHSRKAWRLKLLKVLFLGLWQKLLSEESPKSLKLSGFYKLSSGTSTYLGVVLNKCKRRLRKYFEVRNSTLHRQSLWRESKTSERDFMFKSEAVASKFSRGETLVLGFRKSKEVKTSLVYLTPWGEERTGALMGRSPKIPKESRARSWAFIPESTCWLSSKIPCAKIKSDDLSCYVP
jgi:hypothetical protein